MRSELSRLILSAAVLVPVLLWSAPIRGIDRQEVLEQMKKSRPQNLKVLIEERSYGVGCLSFSEPAIFDICGLCIGTVVE